MSSRKRAPSTSYRDINVTPLIDVMTFLLIITLVTMPIFENAIDVSPPAMNADPLPDDKKSVTVYLDAKNQIFLGKILMAGPELTQAIRAKLAEDPKSAVFLKADGMRSYNEVMAVMKAIKAGGAKNVNLITITE